MVHSHPYGNPLADDLDRKCTPYLLFNQYIRVNRGSLLKRIFSKKEYRTITTVINTEEVTRIEGNLSHFKILQKQIIFCSRKNGVPSCH